jgi:LPS sulfotransferase NodH
MKTKETLEEAAERISKTNSVYETAQDDFYHGFVDGAKWQQERMYSEEDITNALHSVELKNNKDYSKIYNSMKEFLNNLKK